MPRNVGLNWYDTYMGSAKVKMKYDTDGYVSMYNKIIL